MKKNILKTIVGSCHGKRPAVLFLNSNKSKENVEKIAERYQLFCRFVGLDVTMAIVGKGPCRDIDRDAVNELILVLLAGQYEVVVVETMADLTGNLPDLEEFARDAAKTGIIFLSFPVCAFIRAEP